MIRRPVWLSTRRLALVVALAAAAAAAITLLHRRSERGFLAQFVEGISVSAALSADALSDRLQTRVARGDSSALSESVLPFFNIAAPDDRTQRTALIEFQDGRAVLSVASGAGGGTRTPAVTPLPSDLSAAALDRAHYVDALRADPDSTPAGIGIGLAGRPVAYGSARVRGTPWRLLREREVEELLSLLRPSLILTDVVFGALALLGLAVLLVVWRSAHLRREADRIQLRSTFVASISHELRTPLTQIRMYAEMLRLGLLGAPEDRERAIAVIEKESSRLAMLVERSLTFMRAGQSLPPDAPVAAIDVGDAMQRATDAIAAVAAERGVTIDTTITADLRVHIPADDLHQVLLNLLDNAIKYGPTGQQVRLRAERHRDQIRISVQDNGPGIAAGERERIWQPFVRGEAARDGIAGSGIGLVVVHDLIVRAGGRASIVDGSGATFVIELPAA
ncbi:MAG: sensor histidine kinase [Gemmatimonadaceae bacterium]